MHFKKNFQQEDQMITINMVTTIISYTFENLLCTWHLVRQFT